MIPQTGNTNVYAYAPGFPGGWVVKNPLPNVGDTGLIPG